jgi:hypothetical protein
MNVEMKDIQQRKAAKDFANQWRDRGYEKGESQPFWLSLLRDVFGVEKPETMISFEDQVHLDNTSFIDGWIHQTHVLIEQKGINKDLRKPIHQSDGSQLTPFQQAKRYAAELPYSDRPRWIVTCNFGEFLVYDMERPNSEPESILLKDLEKEYYRLQFLVDTGDVTIQKEMEVSLKAGELVGRLYDALLRQYDNPDSEETLKNLNALCVRLVFCLYAEDAGIFGRHDAFYLYIKKFNVQNVRTGLIELFRMLDTKPGDRDKYANQDLLAFPYVNGGLFADENIEIPRFTPGIISLLLEDCSLGFNWSGISPTIFGAVFESTLNPETRRNGGMHYTSIENIHKVIDPLFLDDLKAELETIRAVAVEKARRKRLADFQDKLAKLSFLDPACGSGNFLTETYLSLRRLENEVIKEMRSDAQLTLGGEFSPIKVSIYQFYGIEINDFAATVAKTALWIAESQMMKETEDILGRSIDFLPLKTYNNIHEGNALTLDWESVVPKERLTYIMGNPPFVGARLMSSGQKAELLSIFGNDWKNAGNLDYVSCWYKKATDMIDGTPIRVALVSTNSVAQGEAVANLWKPLFDRGVHIDYAYRTFRWDSEAKAKAHVHCVIIGFSTAPSDRQKIIYEGDTLKKVSHINAYLIEADDIFVESRSKPICAVPEIGIGNKPIDGGNYLFKEDEKEEFIKKEPAAAKYFKLWYGSDEFINRRPRYCLWLGDCTPNEIRQMPECRKRVEAVREFRLASKSEGTRKIADKPTRFHVENMPKSSYIIIPRVSSEKRRYIPMGFLASDMLTSDSAHIIPDATLYHFGILTSNVHNSWMRAVCGRLEMRYRYSKDVVYNNFPWPTPTDDQKTAIEQSAQAILDARALYPDSSLADLYDEVTMPVELRRAHQQNDKAVMAAYGFPVRNFTESDCVAALMKMYEKIVSE